MGPVGTGDWGLGLGLDNSSNIFVIVNYDNAMSLNLTRLKRALGAERSPVKSFYVLYSFCSIHTCSKETDKIKRF